MGNGLAALCREQFLLLGYVKHGLGHLIQRSLRGLDASCKVGVPGTEFDMAVLQWQEGHEEVNKMAGQQLTLSETTFKVSGKMFS